MPKITIRVANVEKLETQFLPELASGGLFIRSDKFLPLGSEVDIDLFLPSATTALPLKGRVTKVIDDDDARARKATGMTLTVDASSEPTKSRLEQLYATYNIGQKKNGANGRNGAHGTEDFGAIPLPGPGSQSAAPSVPSIAPSVPSIAPLAPSIAPVVPPVAPAIPSIAPAAPPKVDVTRFDRAPTPTPPPPPEEAKREPPRAASIPSFGEIAPGPSRAAAASADQSAKVHELESALEKAKEAAAKERADREAAEAKHAEALKRLNDDLAKLEKQKAAAGAGGSGRSPVPAAIAALIIGLLVGAGAMYALKPQLSGESNPLATRPTPPPTVVATKPPEPPPAKVPDKPTPPPAVEDTKPNIPVPPVAVAAPDAGAAALAAAENPEPTPPVAAAKPPVDAGAMVAQADTKTDVPPTAKPPEPEPEPEKPAPTAAKNPENEDVPPLAEKPPKPEKAAPAKPVVVPLGANAGSLNLKSDMPSTVYVNGKKVGNAPVSGYKVNPGKVQVRFDCVVEDVRVKGKTKNVNVPANGAVNVDYGCME